MPLETSRTPARPLRVAVIGAGPAGFYATQALLKSGVEVSLDVLERLPSPHGLVRYGVAPDHETVKSKAFTFDKILRDERVRYFGNVTFGKDLTREEVKQHYDAVIYTVGASSDRNLNISGEALRGSYSATEFVAWYNAHPDHARLTPPLDTKHVAVIGMGNVALDVTRALCKDPQELAKTDMAPYAVEAFRHAKVSDVHILGRRGPSQANFTPKELREVDELPGVSVLVHPADIAADRVGIFKDEVAAKKARRNVELFTEYSRRHSSKRGKRVHIHFFVSPLEVLGSERVEGLTLERNGLEPRGERLAAVGTGELETLEVGLLLRSVGYRSEALPGVSFDEKRGVIHNEGGRVVDKEGNVLAGEYTSGWVRRGPSGVIGTNKQDAEETVRHLLSDVSTLFPVRYPDPEAVNDLLEQKGVHYVSKADWHKIARLERRNGGRVHKRALKFDSVEDMLEAVA